MPSNAAAILAATGVEEDPSYYGPFQADWERAVLTVPMRIQDAWLTNDADAFARTFTADGRLLLGDNDLRGREAIRAHMAAAFRGAFRGAHVKGGPLGVCRVTDDVALVVTEGGIRMAGETETAPQRRINALWMVVRHDGGWQLQSHSSSPAYPPSALRELGRGPAA